MLKNPLKSQSKRKKPDEIAKVIADIYRVSPRYVRMVRDGDETNEEILTAYLEYQEGKNNLIESIKQAIPFTD